MSMCVSKKRDHWDGPTLKKYTWLIYLDKSTWAKIGLNEFGFFLDENFKLLHPLALFHSKAEDNLWVLKNKNSVQVRFFARNRSKTNYCAHIQ